MPFAQSSFDNHTFQHPYLLCKTFKLNYYVIITLLNIPDFIVSFQ